MGGCTPRIDVGTHKPIIVAQLEICEGVTAELVSETGDAAADEPLASHGVGQGEGAV
jgi:hypothetical protein